jgi:hypothetical protein
MESIANNSTKVLQALRLPLFAFIGLVASLLRANVAFMLGFVLVPIGSIAGITRLFDKQHRNVMQRLALYGSCALLVVSGPAGCALTSYRTEAALQPLISALDAFYVQQGKYPIQLSEVGTQALMCPDPARKVLYSAQRSAAAYKITCYMYVFNKHTFNSETRKWADWD